MTNFNRPSMTKQEETHWQTVLTHEAGHAVACLELLGKSADIVVTKYNVDFGNYLAKFCCSEFLQTPPCTHAVVFDVMAAGAAAEYKILGISNSKGFASDLGKIKTVVRLAPEQVSTVLQQEQSVDYPRVRALVQKQAKALQAIAEAAMHRVIALFSTGKLQPDELLLSGDCVKELYDRFKI